MVSSKRRALFASIHKEAQSSQPLLKKTTVVKAEYVPSTQTLLVRNKKKKARSPEDVYDQLIMMSIVPTQGATVTEVFPEEPLPQLKEGAYVSGSFPIIVTGKISKATVSEVYPITFDLKVIEDVRESKKRDEYFEGILQLRNATAQVRSYLKELIANEETDISKELTFSAGNKDLYFTNKKPLKKLALALQRRFGGDISTSKKIFTMDKDTQKDINRDTVLYRLYAVHPGDVATKDGHVYLISKVLKTIVATDIIKNRQIVFNDDNGLHVVSWRRAQLLSRDPYQVLDPVDNMTYTAYQTLGEISPQATTVEMAKASEHIVLVREIKKT